MHSNPSRHSLRVLVADDNRDAANSLQLLLEIWGHEVRTAYHGEEALKVAASFRPHIALLDFHMPRLNGGEVARRLRGLPGAAPLLIVAITAHGEDDLGFEPYRSDFNHYLCKPVNLAELEQILTSMHWASQTAGGGRLRGT
jgi:CheY-like chemotaxis protein